jgi:hypothetical protein
MLYSVKRKLSYNILTEFGVPINLVRMIKMCLNKSYSKVHIGKHLSDKFPVQSGLKQGMLYHHCYSTLL